MSAQRITNLRKIIEDLHEEFKNNDYQVTDKMIADLWLVFGQEDVSEAEKSFKEFQSLISLIHTKIVGGVRDAFLDSLKTKDKVVSLRLELEKSGKSKPIPADLEPMVTMTEISEEYNIPYQTIYKWIKYEEVRRVNVMNPARYYRRDVESMLISRGALNKVSERTTSIEDKYNLDLNKIANDLND